MGALGPAERCTAACACYVLGTRMRSDPGRRDSMKSTTHAESGPSVYLSFGDEWLGLRPADGGTHRDYGVGLEHLAFEVDTSEEVDAAHQRCLQRGDRIHHPPEQDSDIPGYYAFFVFDPDGLRIEVFAPGAEWSAHPQVDGGLAIEPEPTDGKRGGRSRGSEILPGARFLAR